MSNTYGRLKGNRGEVTRTGNTTIRATLNTWERKVEVWLSKDNTCRIEVSEYRSGKNLGSFEGTVEELADLLKGQDKLKGLVRELINSWEDDLARADMFARIEDYMNRGAKDA